MPALSGPQRSCGGEEILALETGLLALIVVIVTVLVEAVVLANVLVVCEKSLQALRDVSALAAFGKHEVVSEVVIRLMGNGQKVRFDTIARMNDLALTLVEADRHGSRRAWLVPAAETGHADAQHWLCRCYIRGQGVQPNRDTGLDWLKRSAAAGHVILQQQMAALAVPEGR